MLQGVRYLLALILVRTHVCLASSPCGRAGVARWRYVADMFLFVSVDLVEMQVEKKVAVARSA